MNANVAIAAATVEMRGLMLRCPVCTASLGFVGLGDPAATGSCARCAFIVANRGSIWRALAPVRELYYRKAAAECSVFRAREGRGSENPEYYLALPYRDLSGRDEWQWRMRARSFEYLASRVLPPIEARVGRPLRVLDIGAGNGWLSYRLALRGHNCTALDLLDNSLDGLGAASHYERRLGRPLTCVQAEMDNLPFEGDQFDVAVFNASLHCSENYTRTLREAIRCLCPGGELIVADTPFYEKEETGRAMVLEKHDLCLQQRGCRPDTIRSLEYVTPQILADLERDCGIRWRVGRPWYGLGWALGPWKANLRGSREPSKFYTFSATVSGQ